MSVPRGWRFFMHPGPTNVPHRVLQAMARPSVDFTGPEFVAIRDRSLERMALVKGSPNPKDAKKFYDFLASKAAQEMLVKKFFRRPIRDDVDTTKVGLPRASALKAAATDDVKLSASQPAFIASWKEMVAAK